MTSPLTRPAASAAVEAFGWRYLLGTFCTSVPVPSLAEGAAVAAAAVAACGAAADAHLRLDVRPTRVELTLQDAAAAHVTQTDVELARSITEALGGRTTTGVTLRPVQMQEIAIDALDIGAIRPFWRAVLAYEDEPGYDGPEDAIVDPARQGPTYWFQQMDAPRPQRNRIHIDITVPHDEADARVAAALEAGGHLVSDDEARAFWVLADAEGNEVCVCTWQDRERA
ncbi:VOC family protein [Jatrophihabitans sp.]|uniref:VOC family protein n=1 Tax=Jatrophihabitans sp. TaxID=1932789 RepID=UPI0030C68FAF|nr:4a-hydroxytetrahydrobiopterin dehydratase [Jatrophihabitans sp.]